MSDGPPDAHDDDGLLALADRYVLEGKIPAALEKFRERLLQDPLNIRINGWIYSLLLGPEQGRGLVDFYKDLQKANPDDWRHLVNLARAYSKTGKDSLAVVQLQKLLRNDPTLRDVWMDLAQCYRRLDKVELALRALNSVIDLHPSFSEAHIERVRLLAKSGELEEAAAAAVFSLDCQELDTTLRDWLEDMDASLEDGQMPDQDLLGRFPPADE